MSVDLQNSYDSAQSQIRASQTYLQIKKDNDSLKRQQADNQEQDKNKITTGLEQAKDAQKRFQKQVKSQMDQLLNIAQSAGASGSSTLGFIKSAFIKAALNVEPKIYPILLKEVVSALGCSQQQKYDTTRPIYIKIPSLDLFKLLYKDPSDSIGTIQYEKDPPIKGQIPYSMNRQMWQRLQNQNQKAEIFGKSGQKLFDISYVRSNGVITNDYFKIEFTQKQNSAEKIIDFLTDYYKSIKLVDMNNLFQMLIDMMCGAVSFEAKLGYGEIEERNKFALLLQRILGLCFDSKKEIDVTGNAKVAELDGVDDSFFDFSDIDLRYIDQVTNNMRTGVIEFEECQNVLLPVDSKSLIDELAKIEQITRVDDKETLINNLTNILTDNEKWKILVPNSVDIKLSVDTSFITNLPKSLVFAILSPKVLLPLYAMLGVLSQYDFEKVSGTISFSKIFKKFNLQMASKIGSLFIEELYAIIKKDIKRLLQSIERDMERDAVLKKYAYIAYLIELILIIIKFISDWRKCKSVIDDILALLNLAGRYIKSQLPPSLVAGAELLPGFSPSRAMISTIEEMQKLGIPTGPMPSGAPNLSMQKVLAQIQGSDKEGKSRKTQVFIKPLTVTPAGITLPAGNIFGVVM